MPTAILDIKNWGNNLGVRLPAAIARAARLHADQKVSISVEGDSVIITPVKDAALTLEKRLELFDPYRHSGEVMQCSEPLGAEKW